MSLVCSYDFFTKQPTTARYAESSPFLESVVAGECELVVNHFKSGVVQVRLRPPLHISDKWAVRYRWDLECLLAAEWTCLREEIGGFMLKPSKT